MKIILPLGILLVTGCLARTPEVGGSQFVNPSIQHANFIGSNTCESCHEVQRPAPLGGTIHGGGNDCLMCHIPKDDNSGWLPVIAFSHVPTPTQCAECHAAERPASPPHPATGDCVLCHVVGTAFLPGTPLPSSPPASTPAAVAAPAAALAPPSLAPAVGLAPPAGSAPGPVPTAVPDDP